MREGTDGRPKWDRRRLLGSGGAMAAGAAMAPWRRPAALATTDPILVVRDQRPAYGGPAQAGGMIRIARPPAATDDFNPASFAMDFQVAASYLEPLLRPDDVTMEPTPWLAAGWRVEDDGRRIVYDLRDDARWHDDSPLTGADVAFSFEVYREDAVSAAANMLALLEAVTVEGDRRVVVRLAGNDPTWPFNASSLPIMQRAQYERYWSEQPIGRRSLRGFGWRESPPRGTGPWRIVEWDDDGVELARHEGYWGPAAWADSLRVDWVGGRESLLTAWRDGATDLLWPLEPDDLPGLGSRRGRLYAADAARVMFAAFNFDNPSSPIAGSLGDPSLRRALSLSIARNGYGRAVFDDFARPFAAGTVAQPWGHDDRVIAPQRDLTQAAALFEAAGWLDYNGDGHLERADGLPLALTLIFAADGPPELARVLARVALDLDTAGVNVVLEALPADAFATRWRETRDYDLIAFAYDLPPGFTDFDLYGSRWDIRRNAFGWNPGGYANPEADAAIEEYLTATTIQAQRRALAALQRAVDEDLFGLWLGFPQNLILVSADLLGFQPNKVWQTANTAGLWFAQAPAAP